MIAFTTGNCASGRLPDPGLADRLARAEARVAELETDVTTWRNVAAAREAVIGRAEARVEQLTEALNDYRAELGKVMEYLSLADHTMYKLVQQSQGARLARARAVLVGDSTPGETGQDD